MRGALLIGILCGCNPLFGIDQTALWDAAPEPDAPAPPVCPAPGAAPRFGIDLTMVPARNVEAFVVDESQTFAAGMMFDNSRVPTIVSGPLGEQPTQQAMSPAPTYAMDVRLAPEGDTVFVTDSTYNSVTYYSEYKTAEYRLVDGTWTQVNKSFTPPGLTAGYSYTLTTPTRGPVRRFLAVLYTTEYSVMEIEWDGTTVTEKWRAPVASFGVSDMSYPSLSADGLRLVFSSYTNAAGSGSGGGTGSGSDGGGSGPIIIDPTYGYGAQLIYYMERATIDVPFTAQALHVDSVPNNVTWPYMREDCGRIYFSALDTVWFLEQVQQ